MRVLLSTTAADGLSTSFANNVGDDATVVFDGTLTWQTDDTGPGPRDFDFVIPFDEPFTYDPSQGRNLLLELNVSRNWDNLENWRTDQHRWATGNITAVGAGPGSSAASVLLRMHWPAQFTFAPEQPTFILGDVNFDGEVNGLDVDLFVDVLLSGPYQLEADMNEDQVVNGLDVDPFVAAVVGGARQIPEPSTLLLCMIALCLVGGCRKYGG